MVLLHNLSLQPQLSLMQGLLVQTREGARRSIQADLLHRVGIQQCPKQRLLMAAHHNREQQPLQGLQTLKRIPMEFRSVNQARIVFLHKLVIQPRLPLVQGLLVQIR